jgi:hypothetical protein
MPAFGTGVDASLGRIDYTPYLQGSLQGSSAIGRGISQLGQGLAEGIKKYKANKEERDFLTQEISQNSETSIGLSAYIKENENEFGKKDPFSKILESIKDVPTLSTAKLKSLSSGLKSLNDTYQSKVDSHSENKRMTANVLSAMDSVSLPVANQAPVLSQAPDNSSYNSTRASEEGQPVDVLPAPIAPQSTKNIFRELLAKNVPVKMADSLVNSISERNWQAAQTAHAISQTQPKPVNPLEQDKIRAEINKLNAETDKLQNTAGKAYEKGERRTLDITDESGKKTGTVEAEWDGSRWVEATTQRSVLQQNDFFGANNPQSVAGGFPTTPVAPAINPSTGPQTQAKLPPGVTRTK